MFSAGKLNTERAVRLLLLLTTAQALWNTVHCWSRRNTFSQELLLAFAMAVPSTPADDVCLPFFFLAITQSQTFNQLICQDKTNFLAIKHLLNKLNLIYKLRSSTLLTSSFLL